MSTGYAGFLQPGVGLVKNYDRPGRILSIKLAMLEESGNSTVSCTVSFKILVETRL